MLRKFKNSLFWKIFFGYIIILVLILGVVSYIININYSRFIEDKTIQYNTDVLSSIIQSMDKYSMKLEQIIYGVYKPDMFNALFDESNSNQGSYEGIKRQIEVEQLVRQNMYYNNMQQDILNIVIYKNDDNFFFIGNGGMKRGIRISELDWYKQFVESNQDTYVFGPCTEDYLQFPESNGEKVILYIKRLHPQQYSNEDSKPAFMMISIRFKVIEQMFQQLMRSEKSGLAIVNPKDQLVYFWNINEKLKVKLENEVSLLSYPEVNNVKPGGKDGVLLTSFFIKGFNWRIVSVNYKEEMLSEVSQVANKVYLMLITGGIVALLLSILIAFQIIHPILNMNSVIKKVEQGNFDVYVNIRSEDEVGQLGKRFNIMVLKIKELIEKVYLAELKEKEARLEALNAQINPHFLFNTLDNINCIAHVENVEIISNLTQSLSGMLRYSIHSSMKNAIIEDELEHVRHYMYIIDVRFDGKIKYTEDVDSELMGCKTIKLLLQPLVENAVQHGIRKRLNCEGNIVIQGRILDGAVEIQVKDDGVGMNQRNLKILQGVLEGRKEALEQFNPTRSGIGLKNVHDRVRLLFGEEWGISVESLEGQGTTFFIKFPAQKNYT